jgi:hypothetical protein
MTFVAVWIIISRSLSRSPTESISPDTSLKNFILGLICFFMEIKNFCHRLTLTKTLKNNKEKGRTGEKWR